MPVWFLFPFFFKNRNKNTLISRGLIVINIQNKRLTLSVVIVFVTYPLKSRDLFYFFIVYVCWRSLSGILDQIMPDSDLAISCERIYKSSASSTAYIYFSKYEL